MKNRSKTLFTILFFCFIGGSGLWALLDMRGSNDRLSWNSISDQKVINHLPAQEAMLFPSRLMYAAAGKHYYSENNLFLNKDGSLMRSTASRSMKNMTLAVFDLYIKCAGLGKNFLYVIAPGKPLDDSVLADYGFNASGNDNADEILAALQAIEVPCLDLRPLFLEAAAEGSVSDYFYRTEHHWNARAGLLAAKRIGQELNDRYDEQMDLSLLDEKQYTEMIYPRTWIGELGQKTLGPLGTVDDFQVMWPLFEHRLTYVDPAQDIEKTGRMDILLNMEALRTDHYTSGRSMYYTYMYANDSRVSITNHQDKHGRILAVKDSLSNVCLPYLALASKQVTAWDVREDEDLVGYLQEHDEIDTVFVCYQTETASSISMYAF